MGILDAWEPAGLVAALGKRHGGQWRYGRTVAPSVFGPEGAPELFIDAQDEVEVVLPNYHVIASLSEDDPDLPLFPTELPAPRAPREPSWEQCHPLCRAALLGDDTWRHVVLDAEHEFAWARSATEAASSITKELRRLEPLHQAALDATTAALRDARDRFVAALVLLARRVDAPAEPITSAQLRAREARLAAETPGKRKARQEREEKSAARVRLQAHEAVRSLLDAWQALLQRHWDQFEGEYRRAFERYVPSAGNSSMSDSIVALGYVNGRSLDALVERRLAPALEEFVSLDMRRVALGFYAREVRAGRYPPDEGVQHTPGRGIKETPNLKVSMEATRRIADKARVLYNAMCQEERKALETREGQARLALCIENLLKYPKETRGRIMLALYEGPARRLRGLRVPASTLRRDLKLWRESRRAAACFTCKQSS